MSMACHSMALPLQVNALPAVRCELDDDAINNDLDDDSDNDCDPLLVDIEPEPLDWSACCDDGFFNNSNNNNTSSSYPARTTTTARLPVGTQQHTDDSTANQSLDISNVSVVSNESEPNQQQQPQRRRVSFREDEANVVVVESFACQDEGTRQSYWYQNKEIDVFRCVARETCRQLRADPTVSDDPRGLELRTSLNRQWRKHLARTCILKAQVKWPDIDPEHLAQIACRCTALPREEAVAQATRDFCAVYYPGWAAFFPETTEIRSCQEVIEDTRHALIEKRRRRRRQAQQQQQPLIYQEQERSFSPTMLSTVFCPEWEPESITTADTAKEEQRMLSPASCPSRQPESSIPTDKTDEEATMLTRWQVPSKKRRRFSSFL